MQPMQGKADFKGGEPYHLAGALSLGPFCWLYERSRPIVGKIYGAAGKFCSTPGLLTLQIY